MLCYCAKLTARYATLEQQDIQEFGEGQVKFTWKGRAVHSEIPSESPVASNFLWVVNLSECADMKYKGAKVFSRPIILN